MQSLDPSVALSWDGEKFSADAVKNSWGTTFGGSGATSGHIQAYASKVSQKVSICFSSHYHGSRSPNAYANTFAPIGCTSRIVGVVLGVDGC